MRWAATNPPSRNTAPNTASSVSASTLSISLTPARWALLARLKALGAVSVYALAKDLGRDYKNVHTDVRQLADLGLIERRGNAEIAVAWDAIRAELRLA